MVNRAQGNIRGRRENLSQANKLSRSYVTLLDALNRSRGRSQQKVTVEHVHIHSRGQAVVRVVETSVNHGVIEFDVVRLGSGRPGPPRWGE